MNTNRKLFIMVARRIHSFLKRCPLVALPSKTLPKAFMMYCFHLLGSIISLCEAACKRTHQVKDSSNSAVTASSTFLPCECLSPLSWKALRQTGNEALVRSKGASLPDTSAVRADGVRIGRLYQPQASLPLRFSAIAPFLSFSR